MSVYTTYKIVLSPPDHDQLLIILQRYWKIISNCHCVKCFFHGKEMIEKKSRDQLQVSVLPTLFILQWFEILHLFMEEEFVKLVQKNLIIGGTILRSIWEPALKYIIHELFDYFPYFDDVKILRIWILLNG